MFRTASVRFMNKRVKTVKVLVNVLDLHLRDLAIENVIYL